ncbi:hypothetical protein [Paenibacillus darwinianus]|uniref:hypothetical protein n=1 Tax=Paenibacillus darwinianus TaxID=1380763 RepID=UPI000AE7A38A|nr:hypothetical protein [Paenibacillus darwinianus]
MSKTVSFDYSKALTFVGQHEVDYLASAVKNAHDQLRGGTGAGRKAESKRFYFETGYSS